MTEHNGRAFRWTLGIVGVVYTSMAASMLVRGAEALGEFGVATSLYEQPVLQDIFTFFYELMAGVGVLVFTFGQTVRARRDQRSVALLLCAACILTALRDLSTSDCALGSRLYRGPETVGFVAISLVLAGVFGWLAWQLSRTADRPRARTGGRWGGDASR
jgi:hypothetical protein